MSAVCRAKQGHCAAFAHARAPVASLAPGWQRTSSCDLVLAGSLASESRQRVANLSPERRGTELLATPAEKAADPQTPNLQGVQGGRRTR